MERYDDDREQIELPPGFRFHPTDEELITHYLTPKVFDACFSARAMGEVDLNKCEPWDLPWRAKMGEKEWYFFCVRDRKYPTGLRTNRATEAGYWKATGKDKEIYKARALVGMKKTLVFYRGRAPKGEKTNWVMHEYRVEGKLSASGLPKTVKNEWVICRVFQKSSGGKKLHIQGMMKPGSFGKGIASSVLPPLMDSSPYSSETRTTINEKLHVTCFSDPMEDRIAQGDIMDSFNHSLVASSSSSNPRSENSPASSIFISKPSVSISLYANQILASSANFDHPYTYLMQDEEQSILKMLVENQGPNPNPNPNLKKNSEAGDGPAVSSHEMVRRSSSFDDREDPSTSGDAVALDYCLWNY